VLNLQAVLFDLDGTLLDTAPDMVGALNDMRTADALGPVDYAQARAQVSNGALGLINLAYRGVSETRRLELRDRFLSVYAQRIAQDTVLFEGMAEILEALEAAKTPWGIVTNKPGALTDALLDALSLRRRCACVVSGDTLARRKPHPDPLLHAARHLGVASAAAMYVGDATRDIQAGKAAGMVTVAAAYGYVEPGARPLDWDADYAIAAPQDLGPVLRQLGALAT
jgi:phosphoglycolate phosphatase